MRPREADGTPDMGPGDPVSELRAPSLTRSFSPRSPVHSLPRDGFSGVIQVGLEALSISRRDPGRRAPCRSFEEELTNRPDGQTSLACDRKVRRPQRGRRQRRTDVADVWHGRCARRVCRTSLFTCPDFDFPELCGNRTPRSRTTLRVNHRETATCAISAGVLTVRKACGVHEQGNQAGCEHDPHS